MIDHLKSMAIFASVAEESSFRGAAGKLSLSPAMVSIHIKKLEEKIGAPLFYRSTRRVTLTQEGKVFYESAKAMIAIARDGLDQFSNKANTHLTELRLAMPDTLALNPIINKLAAFSKNHTGVRLNVMSTDQQQSLIGEGHDVAIRMGFFKDSDLKSKRIGEDKRLLVAAPFYAITRPAPSEPKDLRDWDFISFSLVPENIKLTKGQSKPQSIWGNVIAKANSAQSVHALCVAGMGVAALPLHTVERDLRDGKLVHVLPEWEDKEVLPIYLVWPSNAKLNLATREFINFMSRK